MKRDGATSSLQLSEQNHKWRLFASNLSHGRVFIFLTVGTAMSF